MAEIKDDAGMGLEQHLSVADVEAPNTDGRVENKQNPHSKRVASLDTFRGLTVAIHWIQKHIFIDVWHSRRVGILLYVIFAEILFWGIIAGLLDRLGIYWKL